MSLWRLEGEGLDLANLGPEVVVETDGGSTVVYGELAALVQIMGAPGFHLHLLRRDPWAPRQPTALPDLIDPDAVVMALVDAQRVNRRESRRRDDRADLHAALILNAPEAELP